MRSNLLAFFPLKSCDRNKMTHIRHLAIHCSVKPPEQRLGFSLYFVIVVAQIDRCGISDELITNLKIAFDVKLTLDKS